jgi:hypothetical protein
MLSIRTNCSSSRKGVGRGTTGGAVSSIARKMRNHGKKPTDYRDAADGIREYNIRTGGGSGRGGGLGTSGGTTDGLVPAIRGSTRDRAPRFVVGRGDRAAFTGGGRGARGTGVEEKEDSGRKDRKQEGSGRTLITRGGGFQGEGGLEEQEKRRKRHVETTAGESPDDSRRRRNS